MEELNKRPGGRAADEISLKASGEKLAAGMRYLYRRKLWLITALLLGAMAGLAYALVKKPVYTAQSTFVLEEGEKNGGGGLGQYSSLASAVGIDVGGSTGLFQGDNIIELYKSRTMIVKALLSPADFNGRKELLVDRFIALREMKSSLDFQLPSSRFTVAHDSILTHIVDDLNKNFLSVSKLDKKLTIISVKVRSSDPLFAKALNERLVATVNAFYIQTRTKGIIDNITLLRQQSDSVRRLLDVSITRSASEIDQFPSPNPNMQILRVGPQKRQIDVQSAGAIYTEVAKELEVERNSLQREKPLIQLIDPPVLPLPVERLGKLMAVLTGAFCGLLIAITWLLVAGLYRRVWGKEPGHA